MGERRMLSRKIIQSTSFLKMPITSQYLYMQLSISTDDDGIVEAFNIMRLVGGNEDDLRILQAKGFIHILNDDLITYIIHFNEHNKLRSDRKKDSIYQKLLVQIIPDVKLIESKTRADIKKNKNKLSNGRPLDAKCPPKTSKDKLSKDNLTTTDANVVVVNELIQIFKNKYNGNLDNNLLSNLIEIKGLNIIIKCIEEFGNYVNNANQVEKVFYDFCKKWGTEKAYKKNTSYNNNKLQSTNYTQREYSDEFYDSLYTNLEEV